MSRFISKVYQSPGADNLFAGPQTAPVISRAITLGEVPEGGWKRGTVLALVVGEDDGASGFDPVAFDDQFCTIVDSSKDEATGENVPYCILAQDVEEDEDPQESVGFFFGEFNREALIFGGTDTWETHDLEARKIGLFFQPIHKG